MSDRMRAAAPESSVVPPHEEIKVDLGAGRPDKRKAADQRPIYINVGVVSQARGSAYIEFGNTKIIAACYGPRDTLRMREYSSKGRVSVDLKYAAFAGERRRGYMQDGEEREMAGLLEQALAAAVRLERYPKSSIDVFVTVLEDDGGVFGGAATCAAAALAAGGIEMRDLVAGCEVAWAANTIVVDPARAELRAAPARASLAYMASLGEVCALVQDGPVPAARQPDLIQAAVAGCAQAYLALQHALVRSAHKQMQSTEREAAAAAALGAGAGAEVEAGAGAAVGLGAGAMQVA